MGLKSTDSLMQEACITLHQEEKQCQQSPVEKKIYNRMNSKQTAVEWLYGKSKLRELDKFDLEQAKEMEKQNIEKEKAKSYMEGMKNQFIENEFRKL